MEILYTTNQILPRIGQVDIFSKFEESLSQEKLRKFEKRKDVKILLDLNHKYDEITNKFLELRKLEKNKQKLNSKNGPNYKLRNGKNLFELSIRETSKMDDIYQMLFKYEKYLNMNIISYLPNLNKLEISFSELILPFPTNIESGNFFKSLIYLDLSFNNLSKSVFEYLKEITSLQILCLAGNKLSSDIPDITNLLNLEELDLSYNEITSSFLNTEYNKNEVIEVLEKIQENFGNNSRTYHNANFFQNSHKNPTEENKISQSTYETEFNINSMNSLVNSISGYEDLNKILKTSIQEFFHTISNLKRLKKLDISHNKIHFFDVDPIRLHKENGFSQLRNLNISHNLISEEISIILVVNIPKLECIDISRNPIVENKRAYENIEYEIFKNKNIFMINDKRKKSDYTFFKNKVGKTIRSNVFEKFEYKLKNFEIVNVNKFNENVKKYVEEKSKYFSKIQKEIEEDGVLPILNKSDNGSDDYCESKKLIKDESNLFITKADVCDDEKKKNNIKNSNEIFYNKCESYDQFLNLANSCLGKEKHYKKPIPILNAYQRLRYALSKTNSHEELDIANYMKPTISNINHQIYES